LRIWQSRVDADASLGETTEIISSHLDNSFHGISMENYENRKRLRMDVIDKLAWVISNAEDRLDLLAGERVVAINKLKTHDAEEIRNEMESVEMVLSRTKIIKEKIEKGVGNEVSNTTIAWSRIKLLSILCEN
jgi:UDP-N-acetylmuramyl tripeptide synthase